MAATARLDPGPCRWALPDPLQAPAGEDVVGVGADLEPSTVLAAYARGLFPMDLADGRLGWWSPDPRGVLDPRAVRVTRSLRRSMRGFDFTVDAAFASVIRACRDARPESVWLTDTFIAAYEDLHEMGWAHSVETWIDGRLVGGLYGVELGGLFSGESMFHRVSDASKAANAHLASLLVDAGGDRIIDTQWRTDHMATLGVVAVPRPDYLARLPTLLSTPPAF